MRSLIICLVSALSISSMAQPTISTKDIVGKWRCVIHYPLFNLTTVDHTEYLENGSSVGIGYMDFSREFKYETKHTGLWTISDHTLIETSNDYKTIKIHSDKTMQRLETDTSYAERENLIYLWLTSGYSLPTITQFDITTFTENKFEFLHVLGDRLFKGVCEKQDK